MAERDPAFLCRHEACKKLPACQYVSAGPHPAPKALPSMDPHDYPIRCGPHASGPQEASVPGFYRANGSRPAPYDPAVMARPAPDLGTSEYPAPEVTSKDGLIGPAKRAVGDMERHAVLHGWNIRTTYAKGYVPHARLGTPGATPKESLAVRMWRGEQRAVAVYVGTASAWSWTTLYLWRLGEFPTKYATVTPFLEALELGKPA